MAIRQIQFHIAGMTCQACANRIEKVLNKKDFVVEAAVSFAGETAQVRYDDVHTSPDALQQIIEKTGYQARVSVLLQPPEMPPEQPWRMWLLLMIALPFGVGMLGMMLGWHALMLPVWGQIVLATVVQTYFAWPFYRRAIASIRGGLANMDVLVATGTLVIYLYSLAMVWQHGAHAADKVYFEAGVMVLAFVSLGKHWEETTKRGSLNALGALLALTPRDVSVLKDETWQILPLKQVKIGDVLRVIEGERVAADGVVVAGEGWAQESHLTGESLPVYKTIGSRVLAGALFSGSVDYRVQQLGQHTLLGDMAAALAEAQSSKAPIGRLADKVSAVFVPLVLLVSLLTLGINGLWFTDWTQALIRAVAVLVVACPCALGLATPAAMMAGMGVAVRRGVWFKNAAALETAGAVKAVVFDKTGTLTLGKPKIARIWLAQGVDEQRLFTIAAALERHTAHPLGAAIVAAAENQNVPVLSATHIQTIAGEGVMAQIDGVGEVKVGQLAFAGFRLPEHVWQEEVWQIASVVAVSVNYQAQGVFALVDSLKDDSIAAVRRLREQGMDVHILSGDRAATVQYIAGQLGLPVGFTHAHQSPRDKADFVRQLKKPSVKVAMVGDGINDAPALALADVGFAVRGSTDVAQRSADAVLVRQSLHQLADGLIVARATVRHIKQNLFFALIYNVLGIPFAALGLLTPVLAGAMMAMSSLSVLGNALRLKRMKW